MLTVIGCLFVGFVGGCIYTESKHSKEQAKEKADEHRFQQMMRDQENGEYDAND